MNKEFGMVLSGGGAKGAYQVGAFRALSEYDIKINSISGSSIGGINAFAYASLSLEEIISLWNNFEFNDFISPDDDWSDGISDRDSLIKILNSIVDEDKIKQCIPIFNTICINQYIPEYKLLNNKSKDDIIKILLATSALPIIYSKVDINNSLYQDGGLADNLPIMPLYSNDIKDLIIISLSKDLRVNQNQFKINSLIEIFPSYDLGDLFDGTLNFTQKYISFAMKLGYVDAKRALNNYFGINNGCHTPEFDYNQILQELKVEFLQKSINRNFEYINSLDKKFKI